MRGAVVEWVAAEVPFLLRSIDMQRSLIYPSKKSGLDRPVSG